MAELELTLPSAAVIKQHVLSSLERYWVADLDKVAELPIRIQSDISIKLPLRLDSVSLPDWAKHCGVEGHLLIPRELLPAEGNWRDVDWWLGAFLLLEGWHERHWERKHGPIHSYSARLKGWDKRAWEYAWVNRIGLFLCCWVEQDKIRSTHLATSFPKPEYLLTHDVDAINKTWSIRIKQSTFIFFNAVRSAVKGDLRYAFWKAIQALRFMFSVEDWWKLDAMLDIEIKHQLRARYHFYADQRSKTLKRWLFDPGYDVATNRIRFFSERLINAGADIGLHPSFDSWKSRNLIHRQKICLEAVVGRDCLSCRQHWLRFSWQDTWNAQDYAGLREDTTLMFNDRPGFRNSAALAWHPWLETRQSVAQLVALPTVIMDSHFYDYQCKTDAERKKAMSHWINECKIVGGQVALLWHPHTLTESYGWGGGFNDLVLAINEARQ